VGDATAPAETPHPAGDGRRTDVVSHTTRAARSTSRSGPAAACRRSAAM